MRDARILRASRVLSHGQRVSASERGRRPCLFRVLPRAQDRPSQLKRSTRSSRGAQL